jgi:hypothetical protein
MRRIKGLLASGLRQRRGRCGQGLGCPGGDGGPQRRVGVSHNRLPSGQTQRGERPDRTTGLGYP